jgi:hypothetical protein
LTVEVPADAWAPIAPPDLAPRPALVFVDGVRRLEARVVVRRRGTYAFGAFGSYAVGAVRAANGRAAFERLTADRVAAVASGVSLPDPVKVRQGLVYRPVSIEDAGDDAPLRAIHGEMRRAEERLGRELADEEGVLVLGDGPLSFADSVHGAAVGYVKHLMKLYLEGRALEVLRGLPEGRRTPVFGLRSSTRFGRYSWFMRLVAPRPGDADLSGVVRLEVASHVGGVRACEIAGQCAALLPMFRATRGLHSRAPQNLLPIAALEQRLRHQMGDAVLLRRYVEELLAKEALRAVRA